MPEVKKIRTVISISGQVQNVGFRAAMQKKAQELGVTGRVENLPNNWVKAVIEGEEDKVKALIEWAKKGPRLAKVTKYYIFPKDYQGEFTDFRII